ncbi:VOC family protein [Streptomyces sp. YIM 98790]|uniref:VOC family protein n=1 Tax=Streptomyces sp. YIM 98790 TaxID=2689077 RepID=UPI00140DB7B5|nr:VOC family protein [Streptomyces sp. YIM 98790]
MLTTDYVPGSACWVELGTPDIRAAAQFYGDLFGWEFEPLGRESGEGYGFLTLDGQVAAGLAPLPAGESRSGWLLYFTTRDADATARAVAAAGGRVAREPRDVSPYGRMAWFNDPAGALFAVWQPAGLKGLGAVTKEGSLCWTELYTTDGPGAKKFYRHVFGWREEDVRLSGAGSENYTVVATADGGPERSLGGIMQLSAEHLSKDGGPYWQPYFEVPDCDVIAAAVLARGGRLHMEPTSHEGIGRIALCTDRFGANFAVITSEIPPPPV